MMPTLLRGVGGVAVLFVLLVSGALLAAPLLNPPAPQLSYVSQFSGDDWHITLMDLPYRVSVDLTRDLFDGPARSRLPSWSPDGTRLAFVSDAGSPQSQVYLYDLAAREMRQLTDAGAYYTLPVWSPDGTRLAFGALPSVRQGIQLLDVASGELEAITPPALASSQSPRFSPGGDLLSFVFVLDDNSRHVYLVEPDGANLRHVFGGTPELHEPVWSPDGRYLTVTDRDLGTGQMTVHLVDTRSGDTVPVFRAMRLNRDLAWSPDGARLALSVHAGSESTLLFLRDVPAVLAGERADVRTTVLSYQRDTYQGNPLYTPDGAALVFVRSNRAMSSQELFLADAAGDRLTRLTVNARQDWYPTWRTVR